MCKSYVRLREAGKWLEEDRKKKIWAQLNLSDLPNKDGQRGGGIIDEDENRRKWSLDLDGNGKRIWRRETFSKDEERRH